jgi:hypothetical protein
MNSAGFRIVACRAVRLVEAQSGDSEINQMAVGKAADRFATVERARPNRESVIALPFVPVTRVTFCCSALTTCASTFFWPVWSADSGARSAADIAGRMMMPP